ncbi:hypothetical protein [Streptomyces sp. XY533]|uniref:hypothetical protein n=1 Tax=Streptomyces sp. XY533 TaxID=1519481 RepID=UPI0006AE9008|nr:hypothetical protein [Streptomyces sp. XY533]
MPWFKIDDKAHSHPKFLRAGNAALGLWLRCGSYSAQHITEGHVPAVVAQLYGSAPQAAKLVKAGLWHEHGHDCSRCPDPPAGDYMIHDFLEDGRNTSRAKHEAEKKKARDRQAKHREEQAAAAKSSEKADRIEEESSAKNSEIALEKSESSDSSAGQRHESRRDENVTGIHATTTPVPTTSFGGSGAAACDPGIRSYDTLGDLKRAIRDAGISGVSWNLQASQIERIRQVRDRIGIPAMVAMAVGNSRYRGAPSRASAWIDDWEGLEPETQTGPGVTRLPVVRQPASPQAARRNASRDFLDRLSNELAAGENP